MTNGDSIVFTGKVQIGLLAPRPVARMDFPCTAPSADMARVQAAFTGPGVPMHTRIDWDGIFIATACVIFAATAIAWFWSR